MKDPLDYTEEELNNLSTKELKELAYQAEMKESLYNTQQTVAKLNINSLYGALANEYFPLFNQEIARAITGNGRYFIALLGKNLDKELSLIYGKEQRFTIGGDTDSVYFSLVDFVKKYLPNETDKQKITDWIDDFTNKNIQPIIERTIDEFAKTLNAFDKSVIGADREIIADSAIFAAKKKYFARVIDSEGVRYNPYKMKVIGLEIARSSTPSFIKDALKNESLNILLDGTKEDIQVWLEEKKKLFLTQPLETICKASGVTSINYDLNGSVTVPINSRASIVHNKYIIEHGLEDKFDLIDNDDNIRMAYLIQPNPFNSNVIGFKDARFIEDFRDYIDFDLNFEKYMKAAVEGMAAPLGYDLNKFTEALDEW